MIATLEGTPASCFTVFHDLQLRPQWDEMMESIQLLNQITPFTRILHIKMKAVWPTSARDMVLLSHIAELSDGRFVNVTKFSL